VLMESDTNFMALRGVVALEATAKHRVGLAAATAPANPTGCATPTNTAAAAAYPSTPHCGSTGSKAAPSPAAPGRTPPTASATSTGMRTATAPPRGDSAGSHSSRRIPAACPIGLTR